MSQYLMSAEFRHICNYTARPRPPAVSAVIPRRKTTQKMYHFVLGLTVCRFQSDRNVRLRLSSFLCTFAAPISTQWDSRQSCAWRAIWSAYLPHESNGSSFSLQQRLFSKTWFGWTNLCQRPLERNAVARVPNWCGRLTKGRAMSRQRVKQDAVGYLLSGLRNTNFAVFYGSFTPVSRRET